MQVFKVLSSALARFLTGLFTRSLAIEETPLTMPSKARFGDTNTGRLLLMTGSSGELAPLTVEEERLAQSLISEIRERTGRKDPLILTSGYNYSHDETILFSSGKSPESDNDVPVSIEDRLKEIYKLQVKTQQDLKTARELEEENATLRNDLVRELIQDHPRKAFFKEKLGL